MNTRLLPLALLIFTTSISPATSQDKPLDWTGTYISEEKTLVAVRRMTFTRDKEGSLKVQGFLVGFPDEVPLGETTPDIYQYYPNRGGSEKVLAFFPSDRLKPIVELEPYEWENNQPKSLKVTCYLKNLNGARMYLKGSLKRL